MKRHSRLSLVLIFWLTITTNAALAEDWKPIDPAHLSVKEPVVEKDADAEALFWNVRVEWDDSQRNNLKTVIYHYVRIKVFTERGREKQSDILIYLNKNSDLYDIAARSIKPDGSIVELKKDAIFDRTVRRGNKPEQKAKAFTLPGVEPGGLIEYKFREVLHEHLYNYVSLPFQRDIPVQMVKYSIKPIARARVPFAMRSHSFQCQNTPFVDSDGVYTTTLANVPAFREEPHMPPENVIRPWMLVYYTEDKKLVAEKYWQEVGRYTYQRFHDTARVNDAIRAASKEAIGDASEPLEKLRRLLEYCRTNIKNIRSHDAESDDERTDFKRNEFSTDTLKQKAGTGRDINMLFAAMAIAAGFDAREAKVCDRNVFFFDPGFLDDYFLRNYDIAVQVGDEWKLFDAAAAHAPFGMLRWEEEGTAALISGPKGATQMTTPLSPAAKSLQKRTANLTLLPDGSLEGEVQIELSGHFATEGKSEIGAESPARREEKLLESMRGRLSTVEVSEIHVDNVADPSKPLVQSYRVRVPGYAQVTGKRLLFQPAFFQKGVGSVFPATQRKYPVYFHYPWLEEDKIVIQPPPGYSLEASATPATLAGKLGKYEVKVSEENGKLVYNRRLQFGENSSILFSVAEYPQLKKIFDWIYKSDGYTVSLRQAATP